MKGDGHTLECYNKRAVDDAVNKVLQMRVNRGLNKKLYQKPKKLIRGRGAVRFHDFEMSLKHAV